VPKANSDTPRRKTYNWYDEGAEYFTEITSPKQFDDLMAQTAAENPDKLIIIEFYTRWCHACKKLHPAVIEIASERQRSDVIWLRASADSNRELCRRLGVGTFPLFQFYRNHHLLAGFNIDPNHPERLATSVDNVMDTLGTFKVVRGIVVQQDPPMINKQAKAALRDKEASDSARILADKESHPARERSIAKTAFLNKYEEQYGYDGHLDEIYSFEMGERMGYPLLGHPTQHYMDYCGSSLYTSSQLKAVFNELQLHLFGNPHSANPSSELTEELVDAARTMVLDFFGAPPSDYHVVFTRGATSALQMVGECFPWDTDRSEFVYLRENHNSVLGIREYAARHGSSFNALKEQEVEQWLGVNDAPFPAPADLEGSPNWWAIEGAGDYDPAEDADGPGHYSLFAFPAEDNYSGVKYPLEWIKQIQNRERGLTSPRRTDWKVLLDAAAFVPSQPLNLEETPADFVCVSFYKMFGYPTGLGALIIRTENVDILDKVFWGGGSVSISSSETDFHELQCQPSSKMEDGTVPFLDIIALKHGFDMYKRLGGVQKVQDHVSCLVEYAYDQLSALQHSNGRPVLKIYGKHTHPDRHKVQGGVINFSVLKPDGEPIGYVRVQHESAAAGFHIRTGASCNPGACYSALGILPGEIEQLASLKEGCGDSTEWIFVQRGGNEGERVVPEVFSDLFDEDDLKDLAHPILVAEEENLDEVLEMIEETNVSVGQPGEERLHWEKRPLGSVRMSLGWMSTFEDVHAFVNFMASSYIDCKDKNPEEYLRG